MEIDQYYVSELMQAASCEVKIYSKMMECLQFSGDKKDFEILYIAKDFEESFTKIIINENGDIVRSASRETMIQFALELKNYYMEIFEQEKKES